MVWILPGGRGWVGGWVPNAITRVNTHSYTHIFSHNREEKISNFLDVFSSFGFSSVLDSFQFFSRNRHTHSVVKIYIIKETSEQITIYIMKETYEQMNIYIMKEISEQIGPNSTFCQNDILHLFKAGLSHCSCFRKIIV